MITIEQCRGARGLLGWTQQDLADASGLSKTAINNFEKNHSDIKTESLKAIRMAFESVDIEFLDNNGVRKRSENVRLLKGKTALVEILDDIQETLKNSSQEILISNVDNSLSSKISTQKLFAHMELLKNNGIRQRVLCNEGTKNVLSPVDECRWLPDELLKNAIPSIIYGSKIAMELWDHSMFILISSPDANAAEKKRFEALWEKAQIPEEARDEILKKTS